MQTLSELSTGIEVWILPQTFKDTVNVALQLGVKYLWIDFLCIFQDSNEYWIQQSSIMGNVYRNGLCNLAATGSKDGYGGLFLNRPTEPRPLTKPCYVQSSWTDVSNDYWHVYPKYLMKDYFLDGPLLNRGWVIQERIMAPRILHFGSHQLYWECYQHDACETYLTGLPRFKPSSPVLIAFKQRHQPLDAASDMSKTLDLWAEIICTFSECKLTWEEDKLVALSGVAKAIQKNFSGCQYLAGLWRLDLEKHLLWSIKDAKQSDGKPSMHSKQYRAPSWPWASVDGKVEVMIRGYYSSDPAEIKIVEVVIEPLNLDPTGQVKCGSIPVIGPLTTLSTGTKVYRKYCETLYYMKVNGQWEFCSNAFKPDVDGPPRSLHCLPVQTLADVEPPLFACLILQPTALKKGEFRRWGLIELDPEKYGIQQWNHIQNDEWFEFEEHDGTGKYTITII